MRLLFPITLLLPEFGAREKESESGVGRDVFVGVFKRGFELESLGMLSRFNTATQTRYQMLIHAVLNNV